MTYAIVDALIEADPENAATYDANANALIDRLDALLAEIDAELAPVRHKPFVVLHDAYRYFEERFDLNAAGSITVNPERAPGVQRITEIRDKVRELGGVCVFAEPQFDSKVIDVVTEGTEARSGTIDPARRCDRGWPGALLHAAPRPDGGVQGVPGGGVGRSTAAPVSCPGRWCSSRARPAGARGSGRPRRSRTPP